MLLAAHPGLVDPNFCKSVVMLSAHGVEDGAVGVVINRPLGKTLGEVDGEYTFSTIGSVPLYTGGPVEPDRVLLAAWQWQEHSQTFKLFFGINPEKAEELINNHSNVHVGAYLGHSGWSAGQLEGEIKAHGWVVSPIDGETLETYKQESLWREILKQQHPELLFLADTPDDPSLN